ncbi:MAG: ribonuclease P protein component [Rubricoccaceae bacterium]|nr:ribonuclease P protein component [Rubricoccaceae bacterium]
MAGNRLPRSSRLKRQRLIRALFARNKADVNVLSSGSVLVRFRTVPAVETSGVPVQVGFAISGQASTKVVRNRIRRVLREVYRHHQHTLVDHFAVRPDSLTMMVMYRGKEAEASRNIQKDLPTVLDKLATRFTDDS